MDKSVISRCLAISGYLSLALTPVFPQDARITVKVLKDTLKYDFGYENDLKNCFLLPAKQQSEPARKAGQAQGDPKELVGLSPDPVTQEIRPGKTGDKWLVIFQAHTEQELNLTNKFDPKMRTLKWGTPYDNAVWVMTTGGSAHDFSALLRDWYMQKVRKFATFICIPPHSEIRFLSGYSAPMAATVKDEAGNEGLLGESRPGGGMQWRFYSLPAGTICLTTNLLTEESGKTQDKESKAINLQSRLEACVAFYNKNPVNGIKLPSDLAKPQLQIKNYWDDGEIVKFYLDLSCSIFKNYFQD